MKLIVLIGLFLFFLDDILKFIRNLKNLDLNKYISFIPKRKVPIKSKIGELKNGKKQIFIKTYYDDMSQTLNKTGEKSKLKTFRILSICSGVTAGLIALYLGAYMLVPINLVGFSLVPMWFAKFKDYKYRLAVNAELSVALSVITTSYMKKDNFLAAIEENIEYFNFPVKKTFLNFLSNYKYVDKNINNNIDMMKTGIDNDAFLLWCDNIKICLRDGNHKSSLYAVVEKLNTDRQVQDEIKKEVYKPIFSTIIVICISSVFFFFLPAFDSSLVSILFNTIVGQLIIVSYIISVLFAIDKSVTISTKEEK